MANPLLLLARALLSSEAQTRAAPFAPTGIQQLLPDQSLGQTLLDAVSPLGYMTGIKQEPLPTNLPVDYTVSPTGVMDTAGNQMITGQGVMGFQPRDQYGMDTPYNPAADTMGRDYDFDMIMSGMPDYSRMPTGEISTSPMTTQVPEGSYQTWFNTVDQPDLMEMLFSGESTAPQQNEEEQEDFGNPMGYATPQPIMFLPQTNMER